MTAEPPQDLTVPPTGRGEGTSVRHAVEHLAAGGMLVVTDDEDRENEGDLVLAAESASTEAVAFLLRHGSGIVCAPLPGHVARRLELPPMVDDNTDAHGTAFTVSVDHCQTGTGISARDRALTLRRLAAPSSGASEFRRPGHVFPLLARPGGVLQRAGHTEAAADLTRMAGLSGVAVITELVGDDGVPLHGRRLDEFTTGYGLPRLSIADLARHRRGAGGLVVARGAARLPTRYGPFTARSYVSRQDGTEHLALTLGDVAAAGVAPRGALTRLHSECLTGDVLGSLRCDCGTQLDAALRHISAEGEGVVVYLRNHEGRGVGLGSKLRAYELQEVGRDTVDANLDLGLPVDDRDYGVAAAILSDLGIRRVRLITNNPDKYQGISAFDLELVERIDIPPVVTSDNLAYLRSKRDRLGHLLDLSVVVGE